MEEEISEIKARWNMLTEKHRDDMQECVWRDLLLGFLMGSGVEFHEALLIIFAAPKNGWSC